ncbi:UNVERIFIED_CONTAM: hypothetical protein NCL1_41008 [Trichonephila clavipes]
MKINFLLSCHTLKDGKLCNLCETPISGTNSEFFFASLTRGIYFLLNEVHFTSIAKPKHFLIIICI